MMGCILSFYSDSRYRYAIPWRNPMHGLKVGHVTRTADGTGISVFLFEQQAVGAYLLMGSGPATHELATLNPDTSVSVLHALVLTGGSAFGLYAAEGVMRYLAEHHIGLTLPHGVVPIVPAAAIYDLAYQRAVPPNAQDAYDAAVAATENNLSRGRIGAGTGATVGKLIPDARAMTAGLGCARLTLASGVEVLAYAVVNAVGDVCDRDGNIIAGARLANGEFGNCTQFLLDGHGQAQLLTHGNTTLVAIFTNAAFSKAELQRVTKMAVAGMARAITPIFTCYDGDIAFAISLGKERASPLTVGTLAAEAVQLAIIDAVKASEVIV